MGLFDIFSGDASRDAAEKKKAGLQEGYNLATGALNTGLDKATGYYERALAPWQTVSGTANNVYGAYADLLGVNGAEGMARSRERFTQAPGYDVAYQAALDAVDRGASARGTLSNPATRISEQTAAANVAQKGWNDYVASFLPVVGQAPALAKGQSDVLTGAGNINYTGAQDLAKLGWNYGTGKGDADAAAALADYNASQNMWGAIFNGANLAAKVFGFGVGK